MAVGPVLVGFGVAVVQRGERWSTRLAVVVLVVISMLAVVRHHYVDRYRNEDSRALAHYIQSIPEVEGPILVNAWYMSNPLRHYFQGKNEIVPLDVVVSREGDIDRHWDLIIQHLDNGGPSWFVYSREFHGDLNREIPRRLEPDYRFELETKVAGMDLYRVVPRVTSETTVAD